MKACTVTAWHAAIADVLGRAGQGWTTEDDRAYAVTSRLPASRDERLAARALLRWALVGQHGGAPSAWAIDRLPGGRPVVRGRPDVHVSLAHAAGIVACATAPCPVGVDVESETNAATLADADVSWLADAERAARPRSHDPALPLWLGRRWVAKEAALKALGRGLATDPRSVVITDDPTVELDGFEAAGSSPGQRIRGWRARVTTVAGPCHLALAIVVGPTVQVAPTFQHAGALPDAPAG